MGTLSWFFFGGRIPEDFENLRDAFDMIGLNENQTMLDNNDKYVAFIGIKDLKKYESWLKYEMAFKSGPGRIKITQSLHQMKSMEDLEEFDMSTEKCTICRHTWNRIKAV